MPIARTPRWRRWVAGAVATVSGMPSVVQAQDKPCICPPWESGPCLPRDWFAAGNQGGDTGTGGRPARPRLFRMPFGYLSDPGESEAGEVVTAAGVDDGRFHFCAAADNPYLDFRRPGDPGGLGYFKVQTLVPLLGTESVEVSLGLQAVTPAGLEADGLADGSTVLSPTLVWFHDLGGPAVQGFVGQHLPALGRAGDPLQRGWLYGLAVQQPLASRVGEAPGNLHLFVEALGRQRRDLSAGQRPPAGWELVPGLHWRVGANCWMAGGLSMPLGAARPDPGQWQFTCRWQY